MLLVDEQEAYPRVIQSHLYMYTTPHSLSSRKVLKARMLQILPATLELFNPVAKLDINLSYQKLLIVYKKGLD
jgi:hypothetical protein